MSPDVTELRRRLAGAHPTTRLTAAVRDRVLAELAAAAPQHLDSRAASRAGSSGRAAPPVAALPDASTA